MTGRLNLSRLGINIPSLMCPICESGVESLAHLLFYCPLARATLAKLCDFVLYSCLNLHLFVSHQNETPSSTDFALWDTPTLRVCFSVLVYLITKHIDIRYHWIRDAIEDGMFELNKVHTDDNASDMLTKAVAREKLKICCSFAGMANSSS
ncbi:hypothetical protein Tco_0735482 [Tanacetum coccineum]